MARHDESTAGAVPGVSIALTGAAWSIALEPAGIPQGNLRSALLRARLAGWRDPVLCEFTCSASDSARLLRFYRRATGFFRVRGDDVQRRACSQAWVAIAHARHRAGLAPVGSLEVAGEA